MAKKVVIKVSMKDQKSRTKALKITVGLPGVVSAALQGEEKNQIEVTGEFDSVELTSQLRKKIGYADLVTVEEKKEEKKEEQKEEKKEEKKEEAATAVIPPIVWPYGASVPYYHPIPVYDYQHDSPLCSIM